MLGGVGTLRCVGKDGNTEVYWEWCNTLRCVGKDVNTEVCWEGWEH